MTTHYFPIPDKLFHNYLRTLIGKFYKILPMCEEHSPTVNVYIDSLMFELTGNHKLIESVDYDARYMSLLCTLNGIQNCNEIKTCKREVFKCIRIIEELIEIIEGGD